MDMYGLSSPDLFRIDDLLDFSNDDFFSSSTSSSSVNTATSSSSLPKENPFNHCPSAPFNPSLSTDFTNDLCVPSDDAAELEWLSQFVDDSFSDFPTNSLAGTPPTVRSDTSFSGRARTKRSKAPTATATARSWTSLPESESPATGKAKPKKDGHYRQQSPAQEGEFRRCTHCSSEKTPQWRTGPLGPKTLCNACGVRYKSGRLVPEYRPAASPTFMLTQHSNSHRKVLELRRQKELLRQQQQLQQHQNQQQQEQIYRHHLDFEVC